MNMPPPTQSRPDPAAVRSHALRVPWALSVVYGACLLALATVARGWTGGDARAAILPGVPALLVAVLFWLGQSPRRRRVTMALTTTVAGFLALTTVSSLGAVDRIGQPGGQAVLLQVACLVSSSLFLAATAPAWRRVNAEGSEADELLRMFEEL